MCHSFVDEMLEKTRAGELRSPVSSTLGMNLVEFGRGEATYEMAAAAELGNPLGVIGAGSRLVWAEAEVLAGGGEGRQVRLDGPPRYVRCCELRGRAGGGAMSESGPDVAARFLGAENVERARGYLEALDPELHRVRVARRLGASEEEIREVLRQVAVYAGFPTAWNALATMGRASAELRASAGTAESDR